MTDKEEHLKIKHSHPRLFMLALAYGLILMGAVFYTQYEGYKDYNAYKDAWVRGCEGVTGHGRDVCVCEFLQRKELTSDKRRDLVYTFCVKSVEKLNSSR